MNLQKLQKHINRQTYDKNYQDIEILDFIGYSKTHISWDNISNLKIDWQRKTVCDVGCFHSYFGIKVFQAGASKVYGLDNLPNVLETSKLISKASNAEIEYLKWEGGEETPECDIALILNVLHHCKDQHETLEKIKCSHVIFEVNTNQLPIISKYFNPLASEESHRDDRIIVYAEKI